MPAKVIVKSGYIKNVQHMQNALTYVGTKIEAQLAVLTDGSTVELGAVDKLTDSDEVQTIRIRLANGKTKDLTPARYKKYVQETSQLLEDEVLVWEGGEKLFDSAEYLKYIAYRPSAEIAVGKKHGLFNLDGDADIDMEKQKLLQCDDCLMWSHIVSLERSDAQRTGYDCRAAWQNLITAKSMDIARIYNIDPKSLRLNAAYHDKDEHPHIHMFFYSTQPREGIVQNMQTATEKMKSLFFNEIFKDDVSYLKAAHHDRRSQLEERLRGMLKDINRQSYKPLQEVCDKLLELSVALHHMSGKLVYAYQKPEIKHMTDELVQLMVENDPHLREMFGAYAETQREFVEQYNEDPAKIEKRMDAFKQHFFHPRAAAHGKPGSGDRAVLHNEVLRFAATLSDAVLTQPAKSVPAGATAQKETELPQIPTCPPQHKKVLALDGKMKYIETNSTHQAMSGAVRAQKQLRFKARYTTQLLMRASARLLAQLARENDSGTDRKEGETSNLTRWSNLKEPHCNFIERESIEL